MALPDRSDIDKPQTWSTFKTFILALWDKSALAEGFQITASAAAAAAASSASTTQALRDSFVAVQGSMGYLPPVVYAVGINLTLAAQTVGYSGQTYAPVLSALPFTTSGTFETVKFRLIQGISGADLAAGSGSLLMGEKSDKPNTVALTTHAKLGQRLGWMDFGIVADGITDDAAAVRLAGASGREVDMPDGTMLLKSKVVVTTEGTVFRGKAATWAEEVTTGTRFRLDPTLTSDFGIEFKNPARGPMRSIGMTNVGIDCGTSNSGGLAVRGAYDASDFSNINIVNVPIDKIGFATSAGNRTTREGPCQTFTFNNIWAIHRVAGTCTAPAVFLADMQECAATNIKASHGTNQSIAPAMVMQSCAGLTLISPAFVNRGGYGLMVRENYGPCIGVTIITPTYEECQKTIGTDSLDTRMFGTINAVPALGTVVRQPADGSTASGIVWLGTAIGVYARDTAGAFATGNLYSATGVLIGNITSLQTAGNDGIKQINPRTLGSDLSGVQPGTFASLVRSDIDLPLDTDPSHKHFHIIAPSVKNSIFRQKEFGRTTNNSMTCRVETATGELVFLYPQNYSLPSSIIDLGSFPGAAKIKVAKNGGAFSFLQLSGAGVSLGQYGITTLRLYSGYVCIERSSDTSWEITEIQGILGVENQGMISKSDSIIAFVTGNAVDSSTHGANFTNTGAPGYVSVNASAIGSGSAAAILIGTEYVITKTAARTLQFIPDVGDIIQGAPAAGKYLQLTDVGSSVRLKCLAAGLWVVIASAGAFTFAA